MPKVSKEYIAEKKKYIADCVMEILNEKPLNQIVMSDIIKKTGFSQGALYRYYSNVGEIFLDYVNANTPENVLEQKIDRIIANLEEPEKVLNDCIISIGEYIIGFIRTINGKTCCQMISTYGYDAKSYNSIILEMKYKQSIRYAQNELMKFLNKQTNLSCTFTLDSVAEFIGSSIDGIASDTAIIASNTGSLPDNAMVQFEILASMAVHLIFGK